MTSWTTEPLKQEEQQDNQDPLAGLQNHLSGGTEGPSGPPITSWTTELPGLEK
jgi:hypothetical protein